MKKVFFSLLAISSIFLAGDRASAQTFKVGVFDIDAMVTAMPGYRAVDSMLNIYQRDSLTAEYQVYLGEFQRLDSTYKIDSPKVATGQITPAVLQYTKQQREQMYMYLSNFQTYAQRKLENKKGELAQGLYQEVETAYKKVLDAKKYNLVLKPGAYEFGFHIDNIFISVAKGLGMTQLPQEFLVLGEDPDAPVAPAGGQTGGTAKPAAPKQASH